MDEDEARRRVAAARVARLATVDADGHPHVVPICFALDGDRLVSVVDHKPKRSTQLKRLANVAAHPTADVIVDHYDDGDWTALWWVRVSGRAHVVESGASHDAAVKLLARKYQQYLVNAPAGPVLVIEVDTVRHWEGRTG